MDLLRALLATLGLAVVGIAYGAEAGSDVGADALRTAAAPEMRLGTIEVIAERFDKARNAFRRSVMVGTAGRSFKFLMCQVRSDTDFSAGRR